MPFSSKFKPFWCPPQHFDSSIILNKHIFRSVTGWQSMIKILPWERDDTTLKKAVASLRLNTNFKQAPPIPSPSPSPFPHTPINYKIKEVADLPSNSVSMIIFLDHPETAHGNARCPRLIHKCNRTFVREQDQQIYCLSLTNAS